MPNTRPRETPTPMATLAEWLRPLSGVGVVEPVGDELSAPLPVAFDPEPEPVAEELLLVDEEEEEDEDYDDEEEVEDGMTPMVVSAVGVAGGKSV